MHRNMGPSVMSLWSFKTGGLMAVVSQDRFHCTGYVRLPEVSGYYTYSTGPCIQLTWMRAVTSNIELHGY